MGIPSRWATLRRWLSSRMSRRRSVVNTTSEVLVIMPNDNESSSIHRVLSTLSHIMKSAGVSWCVLGDLLLAHYLVPQNTRVIEICVKSESLEKVRSLLDVSTGFCSRITENPPKEDPTHLDKVPRFQVRGMKQSVCVVTEAHCGLSSSAFSDLLEVSICRFPLLPLPHYVQGLANVVTSQGEKNETFVVQIECLIDGMDLDEEWCRKYLDGPAQEYVLSKSTPTAKRNRTRLHPKREGNMTTFIPDERERQKALRVIGRTMELGSPSSSANKLPAFPIQVMSDLHLELKFRGPGNTTVAGYDAFDCKPCAGVLALLGDIGLASHDGLIVFLRRQLRKYEKILYVMGNHEFYDSSYEVGKGRLRSIAEEFKRQRESDKSLGEFILLDQTRVDLDARTTVLGCTLWSHIPSTASEEVGFLLNDFRRIHQWTVETYNAAHRADAAWLDKECAKIRTEEPDRRIIVLTHHAPAMSGTSAPRHENQPNTNIKTAFATDMTRRSCWGPPLKVWAFGHTHFSCDFVINDVRILSNQRGYEGIETRHGVFRDDFVLYI